MKADEAVTVSSLAGADYRIGDTSTCQRISPFIPKQLCKVSHFMKGILEDVVINNIFIV